MYSASVWTHSLYKIKKLQLNSKIWSAPAWNILCPFPQIETNLSILERGFASTLRVVTLPLHAWFCPYVMRFLPTKFPISEYFCALYGKVWRCFKHVMAEFWSLEGRETYGQSPVFGVFWCSRDNGSKGTTFKKQEQWAILKPCFVGRIPKRYLNAAHAAWPWQLGFSAAHPCSSRSPFTWTCWRFLSGW